ncbi:CRISPR-associated protein [Vulcanisaeta sp. JCM 14467]
MAYVGSKEVDLVSSALRSVTFKQGVREAKKRSPQSYIFHAVSVGVLSLDICRAIYNESDVGRQLLSKLADNYGMPYEELCFYGGFLHDWNKLEGKEEGAREIMNKLGLGGREEFLHGIAAMAEGSLPDNQHLPLWVSIKLADMLMISEINSVNDVFKHVSSRAYQDAVRALENFGLRLGRISATFRLFTLIASRDLLNEVINGPGYYPLISYPDGLVFLRRRDAPPIPLSKIADVLNKRVFTSSKEEVESKVEEIRRCLNSKIKLFREMNIDVKSAIYKDDGKMRQVNEFLPTKVCKPFEDIVGNLDNAAKLEVARSIIKELGDEIPYGVLMYFVHKFSKSDKDYIRRGLGISEGSLEYLESLDLQRAREMLGKILELLQARYPLNAQGIDKTLQYYVKHSFSGDVIDDLPPINEKPKNYCVVCGMPIYSEGSVRFVQYATELGGKSEIWVPRERGLENIDDIRDELRVCPICTYEANALKSVAKPPYFIITFQPGVPVSLLEIIDFEQVDINYSIDEDENYYSAFKRMGGGFNPNSPRVLPGFFSSKVLIKASEVIESKLSRSTRLSKSELNKLLPYAHMISIVFLTSPVAISSSIYEIPSTQNYVVSVTSAYNYAFINPLKFKTNLNMLYALSAYSAKYLVIRSVSVSKDELDNNLNSMVNEADLYSTVDPSLGILSVGMGIGTPIELDARFFRNLKLLRYILDVAGRVSEMGKTIRSSIYTIAHVLREVVRSQDVTKYDVVGFLRDGVDMFFRTSTIIHDKDDRIGVSINAAISSLENKYSLNDVQRAKVYSALEDLFESLYEIEEKADRSLAISIANTLSNWLYIAYKIVTQGDKS